MEVAIGVPLAVVGAGVGLWAALGYLSGRAFVEHAKYDMIKSHAHFQVRRYHPSVAAVVRVDDPDVRRAGSRAFRNIAGYIFGGNAPRGGAATRASALLGPDGKGVPIAMTTPVVAAPVSGSPGRTLATAGPSVSAVRDGGVDVSFIMPSKFRCAADLPLPLDSSVQLLDLPERWEAVVGWYGSYATQEVFEARAAALLASLRDAGYAAAAPSASGCGGGGMRVGDSLVVAKSYSYDPPWTPWFMKVRQVPAHGFLAG